MNGATWSDGSPRSQNNAFTGHTGVAPIEWSTTASAAYATRVNNGTAGFGHALDASGRKTVLMEARVLGSSIATPADKKVKRQRGAAI